MRATFSLLMFMCLCSVTACAQSMSGNHNHSASSDDMVSQEWAKQRVAKSPRHREWVKIKNGTREVNSFVVYPENKNKATAVIVIHEIFGMSDWVQSLTDQLAEAGYVAIAPDLLSGMGPNGGGTESFSADAVGKAIQGLPPDQITGDLNAVADYIGKVPASNGKIVVTGYCWGGGQSFRYATNNPNIKAAFVFYGPAPGSADGTPDKAALAKITAPVYGFYAGNDARIDATLPKTTEAMAELKKKYEPVTYEGAGHGFMRAGEAPDANEANKKARDEAWARWKKLLAGI
jgi:carboxymethylenebutenolidase